jgi:hypothetical protein
MRICGKPFTSELINRIQASVDEEPAISRRSLSRSVCQWQNWRSSNGKLQEMSCRKALLELDRRGILRLPETSKEHFFKPPFNDEKREPIQVPELECDLSDLGGLEIVPIRSRFSKESRIWNVLIEKYHYLGRSPLCGSQIRYLIRSELHGWLGSLKF